MAAITLLDKKFEKTISSQTISQRVNELATELEGRLSGHNVLFLGILNGAFMFTADLVRASGLICQVSFIRFASYLGSNNSGKLDLLMGLNEPVTGKAVVLVEDIVDTGATMKAAINSIVAMAPEQLITVSLLVKPDHIGSRLMPDLYGFEAGDEFVVGYGLDYYGYGRNLTDIYKLIT